MHWIDPESLPEVTGTLERFTPNPKGKVDGFIFEDGTFVHIPPHLSEAVLALVHPGDSVRVRGVRPRGVPDMIAAVALTAPDGRTILDEGPPDHDGPGQTPGVQHRGPAAKDGAVGEEKRPGHDDAASPKPEPMQVSGFVRRALHGPKGELRGALLTDGTVIRLGPKEAERFSDLLRRPGGPLAARGDGVNLPGLERAIEAHEIGLDIAILQPVKAPKHEGPRHKKPKHEHGLEHHEPRHA